MIDASQLPPVEELGLEHPEERAFVAHMRARENALATIFGPSLPANEILVPSDANLLINWAGGGVYQYAPRGERTAWHYVTSGLSQPTFVEDGSVADEPDDSGERQSGIGIELVISTRQQVGWASDVLFALVEYLLFSKNSRLILPGSRLPCNGPLVVDSGTPLDHLVATTSPDYDAEILLPAGKCELVHLVGVTGAEIARARAAGKGVEGSMILCLALAELGVGVDSVPERACLTTQPEFDATWQRIQRECAERWKS